MPRSKGRTGRPYRRLQRRVFAEESVCRLCSQPVDHTLTWPHPMSRSLHHLTPLSTGGAPLDRANAGLTHLLCNERYGDGTLKATTATTTTSRHW